jgi:hypothetical protein
MRVLTAGLWTHVVYTAIIIGTQKRAGRYVQDPIIVFINVKILFREVRRLHAQVLCNSVYIDITKNWRGCFTTIRALQAINTFECFLIQWMKRLIDIFSACEILQKFLILLLELDRLV